MSIGLLLWCIFLEVAYFVVRALIWMTKWDFPLRPWSKLFFVTLHGGHYKYCFLTGVYLGEQKVVPTKISRDRGKKLTPGLEPGTFSLRMRCSNHWATRAYIGISTILTNIITVYKFKDNNINYAYFHCKHSYHNINIAYTPKRINVKWFYYLVIFTIISKPTESLKT